MDDHASPMLRERLGDRTPLGPAVIVWLLGISQIIGYGTLEYSFSILAGDIAKAFEWPVSRLYGSFSVALLVGGFITPIVGRRIDRHGAAAVMALGSALAAVTLVAAAFASNAIAYTVALVAMQAASALVLYDAAFAALVQATGSQARLRITHLTLIAGFASTLFWPLTSWLKYMLTWSEILLLFAALNFFVCLPIHIVIARQCKHSLASAAAVSASSAATFRDESSLSPALQARLLWLVTTGFALSGLALAGILAQMVPLLSALGLGASALLVSTLFGPAQVLVRLVNMLLGVQRHPLLATMVGLGMLPIAILVLMATAPAAAGAAVFAILLGFGSGLKSIVQGTLPLALFGAASYGARLGHIASARQILGAIAPFALAFLIDNIGPTYALAVLAVVAAIGFIFLWAVARIVKAAPAA